MTQSLCSPALVLLFVVGCGDSTVNASAGSTETDASSSGDGMPTGQTMPTTSGLSQGTATTSGGNNTTGTDSDGQDTEGSEGGTLCPPVDDSAGAPTVCADNCGNSAFDLEHISGLNYQNRRIDILSPNCVGPACPAPLGSGTYGSEPIVPCEQSAEAQASLRGPEAYCRLAPIAQIFGLELGFTQAPDPDSVTLFRPSIDNAGVMEPYVWKTGIVRVEGPISEYAGRWTRRSSPERSTVEARNLTCIANLEALGLPHDPNDPGAACDGTYDDGGTTRPLRMRTDGVFTPTTGQLDGRSSSCGAPGEGPDTCCSGCDHQLSVGVAKYGIDDRAQMRSPNAATAIECNTSADRLSTCADFRPGVDRTGETVLHRYEWDGCLTDWPMPLFDRLRQTHPDARPDDAEFIGPACSATDDCDEGLECMGTTAGGNACAIGSGDCRNARCRPGWYVECRPVADEVGPGYCVDSRFKDRGAAACHQSTTAFDGVGGTQPAASRLAMCDLDENGLLTQAECCQDALGNEAACDPLFQAAIEPLGVHDRDASLPATARCVCTGDQPGACDATIEASCQPPLGSGTDPGGAALDGDYAIRTVRRQGGTRYNNELDGFDLRLGAIGRLQRGLAEQCAQDQGLIDPPSPGEAWIAHRTFTPSLDRDFDVSLCSDSKYEIVFAGPDDAEHLRSAGDETLAGKQRYVLETSQFLVTPGSGFPTDNLTIGACDSHSIRFSNRYDLSVLNLRKLSLWELEDVVGEPVATVRVAGGSDCDPDATSADVAMGAIPCLQFDIDDFFIGELGFGLDPAQFGDLLEVGRRYRLIIPGLADPADIANATAYAEAFLDTCGMPLITGDLPEPEYEYDFTVDQPC